MGCTQKPHLSNTEGQGGGINTNCHGLVTTVPANHSHVLASPRVFILYWDPLFVNNSTWVTQMNTFIGELIRSPFMTGLQQYGVSEATLAGWTVIDMTANPAPAKLDQDSLLTQIANWIKNGTIGVAPASNETNLMYFIFPPKATQLSLDGNVNNFCGFHHFGYYNKSSGDDNLFYGTTVQWQFATLNSAADFINSCSWCISHELAEAFSDRDGNGFVTSGGCEIGDICECDSACNSIIKVPFGAYTTEKYWSNADQKCIAGIQVDWSSMGAPAAGLLGGVAVVSNADGRLELFASGRDGSLNHIWQTAPNNGWSPWQQLAPPSGLDGPPVVSNNADGRIEIFTTSGSSLWHMWQSAPSNGWGGSGSLGQPPNGIMGAPVVGRNQDGRLEVFAVSGGQLWHLWQTAPNNGWSGWGSLGAPAAGLHVGDPRVHYNADGRLEVFCLGGDGSAWHIWQTAPNNGWSGWSSLGKPAPGITGTTILPMANQDGRMELFVTAGDGNVWHIWQTSPSNGWSGWSALPAPQLGIPVWGLLGASNNADGRIEVFSIGSDGMLWHIWQTSPNNGWSGWECLLNGPGGSAMNGDQHPSVGRNADGRLEVFLVGGDNHAWHIWQVAPNGLWGGLFT